LAQTAKPSLPSEEENSGSVSPMKSVISALAGTWSAEEVYEPGESAAKGGKGHSIESYRVGPADSSLIEEYHGDGVQGKSWGIGTIWWDAKAHGLRFVWCDSSAIDKGCRVSSELGSWDGRQLVMNDRRKVEGKTVVEKEVWSRMTANSFTQTLYVGDSVGTLKLFLTVRARRRGATPH
jgi:hypothetical protein